MYNVFMVFLGFIQGFVSDNYEMQPKIKTPIFIQNAVVKMKLQTPTN